MNKTLSTFFLLLISTNYIYNLCASTQFDLSYGSAISLVHIKTDYKLLLSDAAWKNGSGQSLVTIAKNQAIEDGEAFLWLVKAAHNEQTKPSGKPLKCGNTVRFQNSGGGLNLHSHPIKSALSSNNEVSGFGNKGNGDKSDNWTVECTKENNLKEDTGIFYLKHNETNGYLCAKENYKFTQKNCPRCPILGHIEVAVYPGVKPDKHCQWKFSSGILFQETSDNANYRDKDEL